MATAEQLKALLKAHYEQNEERFSSIALQVAAYEVQKGHASIAYDIRTIIDNSRKHGVDSSLVHKVDNFLFQSTQEFRLSNLVLEEGLKRRIKNFIDEYKNLPKLMEHGLAPRKKILLAGDPGTGKTMTASVIATELRLPLLVVQIDRLISRYLGETASKLREIFDCINQVKAVYLFDEFDAIGTFRQRQNDVGEIGRVVSAFLQFLEQSHSNSIIIAATNNKEALDPALFRRYDDIFLYKKPSHDDINQLLRLYLVKYKYNIDFEQVIPQMTDLSHAEIAKICNHTIKRLVLNDFLEIETQLLLDEISLWKNNLI